MSLSADTRVLSIQSHVTHGYVGNKVATFALQLLGVDVDPLQVVEFSNHTGYPVFRGKRTSVDELRQLVEGLRLNGFLGAYDCVLSGYIGNSDVITLITEILDEISHLRQQSSTKCCFVCDPVLGDNGKFYVSESVVASYRNSLLQHAHVATPNGFEAAVLTQVGKDNALLSVSDAVEAAQKLHDMGVAFVVIKSFHITNEGEPSPPLEQISFLTSVRCSRADSTFTHDQRLGNVVKVSGYVSGSGDLFGASLTGRLMQHEQWLEWLRSGKRFPDEGSTVVLLFHDAVELCMRTMREVIRSSASHSGDRTDLGELRVVQNAAAIVNAAALEPVNTKPLR